VIGARPGEVALRRRDGAVIDIVRPNDINGETEFTFSGRSGIVSLPSESICGMSEPPIPEEQNEREHDSLVSLF
jgi:hypothetical protein